MTWQTKATLQTLRLRAQMMAQIRAYFDASGFMEVETPILMSEADNAPHLDSLSTKIQTKDGLVDFYLQTSPEFAMKRLFASTHQNMYQLAHVFRDKEIGHNHTVEFKMLEWYRANSTYHQEMEKTFQFLSTLLNISTMEKISYRDAFLKFLQCCPLSTSIVELKKIIEREKIDIYSLDNLTKEDCLDLLMSQCVEPKFNPNSLTFVYDYPASFCAYAEVANGATVAMRFEVFAGGLELGNGYQEVRDSSVQERRLLENAIKREKLGKKPIPLDKKFIEAVQHMPPSTGVAVGVDRLVMLKANETYIHKVQAFAPSV